MTKAWSTLGSDEMNKKQLREQLEANKFDSRSYNLDGKQVSFGYLLHTPRQIKNADSRRRTNWSKKHDLHWLIEWCEQGEHNFVAEFSGESDACEYFLMKMLELYPGRASVAHSKDT